MERDEVDKLTTRKFSGYVGLVDAKSSWVGRLIGCKTMPSGVYAAHVADADAEDDDDDDGDDADGVAVERR